MVRNAVRATGETEVGHKNSVLLDQVQEESNQYLPLCNNLLTVMCICDGCRGRKAKSKSLSMHITIV